LELRNKGGILPALYQKKKNEEKGRRPMSIGSQFPSFFTMARIFLRRSRDFSENFAENRTLQGSIAVKQRKRGHSTRLLMGVNRLIGGSRIVESNETELVEVFIGGGEA